MPQRAWAANDELLAADLQTFVQNQVVATFASAAARASAWPSPATGALSYLADTKVYDTWDGAAWVPATPRILAYHEKVADQTGITTAMVDLAGLVTVPLAIPAGRRIEVAADVMLAKGAPDTTAACSVAITDNAGTTTYQSRLQDVRAASFASVHQSRVLTPAAATYQFRVRANTGAGFVNLSASATYPAWLRITDLGPA